ncbi:MAG: hypothetical protein R3B82_19040 [Sandaracinaceae bacterium]
MRHLLAPSAMHHVFLDAASARYPAATVHAPPALVAKRPKGARRHDPRAGRTPSPFSAGIETLTVAGVPKVDEVILFHRPSRSLVVCDLVFHVHEARGWISPLFFRLIGAWRRVQQGPLWRSLTKDRAAAERSLEPMWGWDFDRVIVAHGRILEGPDAKARLAEGLRWMCPSRATRALPAPAQEPVARSGSR